MPKPGKEHKSSTSFIGRLFHSKKREAPAQKKEATSTPLPLNIMVIGELFQLRSRLIRQLAPLSNDNKVIFYNQTSEGDSPVSGLNDTQFALNADRIIIVQDLEDNSNTFKNNIERSTESISYWRRGEKFEFLIVGINGQGKPVESEAIQAIAKEKNLPYLELAQDQETSVQQLKEYLKIEPTPVISSENDHSMSPQ